MHGFLPRKAATAALMTRSSSSLRPSAAGAGAGAGVAARPPSGGRLQRRDALAQVGQFLAEFLQGLG